VQGNGKFCYFKGIRKLGIDINKTEAAEMQVMISVVAVTVRRLIRTKNLGKYRLPNIIGVSHLKLKKWSEQLEKREQKPYRKNTYSVLELEEKKGNLADK